MTGQEIAAALGGYSVKPGGGFMATCPAHDDKNPSLAIDENNGTLLFKCFTGCEQSAVINQLKMRGLWPTGAFSQEVKSLLVPAWTPVSPIPNDPPPPPTEHPQHGKPAMTWRYLTPDGDLLQLIYRFDSADRKKQVLPLTYCTDGTRQQWRWRGLPEPRPLYGLELLEATKQVVIVEGEKAADAARRVFGDLLTVVTWSGGSNAVNKTDWSPLAGKTVAIWPDADKPGMKASLAAGDRLVAIGCTVKVIEPPHDVSKGWDLADAEYEGWTCDHACEYLKAALPYGEYKAKHGSAVDIAVQDISGSQNSEGQLNVLTLYELLAHEFPPRENILSPWLPTQGVTMVYAGRGIGKTFFALSVGLAVASGGSFLGWTAPRARSVLLLDGEMPGAVLQERAAAFVAASDLTPGDFRVVTPDMQPGHRSIDLSRAEDQEAIEEHLDGISLIIVDNLSTLCRTGRENEGEGWLPVQEWALKQRAMGRSIMFIHHAGKGGNQRGTSRREDILDTVIALRRPARYTPDMGALFEVHFEKSRGIYGEDVEPIEAALITAEDGCLTWTHKSVEVSTYDKVVELLREGLSITDIANELGINKSTASRHSRKAKSNGDFNG